MIRNLSLMKPLWILTALLSLVAATAGVIDPGIYHKVIPATMLPGTVSQDAVTIIVALIVLILSARIREDSAKAQCAVFGLVFYLFYGYGIWVIERMYTVLYLLYIAIFALAFWTLIVGLSGIRREVLPKLRLDARVRGASAAWSLLNPLIFYPLWISQLLPLMQAGDRVEYYYSIYILDLAFVMPALVILAILTIRNCGLGLLLTPAVFVKGFAMLFSVGLGGLMAPLYGQPGDYGQTAFYFVLAAVFLGLTIVHFRALKIDVDASSHPRQLGGF